MSIIENIDNQFSESLSYEGFRSLDKLNDSRDIELAISVESAIKKLEPGINKLLKGRNKFGIAVALTKKGGDSPIVAGLFGSFDNQLEALTIAKARAYDLKERMKDIAQGAFVGREGYIISAVTNDPGLDDSIALAICIGVKILTVDKAEEISEKINNRKFMENEDIFIRPFLG